MGYSFGGLEIPDPNAGSNKSTAKSGEPDKGNIPQVATLT